jgi:hypothetical protein
MKGLVLLIQIYFGIGAMLVIPMEISYLYASWYVLWNLGWAVFSLAGISALIVLGWSLAIAPTLRALLWLPSLALWFLSGREGFWMWLAPGFFTTVS